MNDSVIKLSSQSADRDPESDEYRKLPHNEEAEQALLGALLTDNRAFEKVEEFLRPEHFYTPVHGRIYEYAVRLIEKGQVSNPVTLKSYFDDDEDLEHVGGAQYLVDLAANVISTVNVHDYGTTIYNHFLRRELIELGEGVVNTAYVHDLDKTPVHMVEEAETKLFNLVEFGDQNRGFISFNDSMVLALETAEKAYKAGGDLTGIDSGFKGINRYMGGLHRSDLIILAGRPGMGKTSLVTNIAYQSALKYHKTKGERGARVAFFSLEMSAEQLALRIMADAASVQSQKIRQGQITETEFVKFAEVTESLSALPLHIDDTPALTIAGIRNRARRMYRKYGLDMIIIDYLQLLSGSAKRAGENRVQEISEISRGLKTLAKELNVPVIALSQLSRKVEERTPPIPMLSDLRESGSIEQDADVVMFVYREAYYLDQKLNDNQDDPNYAENQKRLEDIQNDAQVIISKQRHGPTGSVNLHFEGQFTRFSDRDTRHNE